MCRVLLRDLLFVSGEQQVITWLDGNSKGRWLPSRMSDCVGFVGRSENLKYSCTRRKSTAVPEQRSSNLAYFLQELLWEVSEINKL